MSDWRERWQGALMDNYGTPPIMLVRGSGSRVWDDEGTEYIDLIAGIAVNAIGHAHPRYVDAVTGQLSTLGHTSNLYATEPAIALAERLIRLAGTPESSRVFFCNSGAEANEAAFKLSRLTGRGSIVVAAGSFHGRTMGALALTAQPAKQDPFRPLPGDVSVVAFGDEQALRDAVSEQTAAVFLEPIQGEGGVVVPPDGYLAAARQICDEQGALLVLDEVQTGIGRTGWWFAHQRDQVVPDIMTLAKGLGGGLPIGAVLASGKAAELLKPGSHGSTFGGNPVVAAAALAVLDIIEDEGLLARATLLNSRLSSELVDASHGLVDHVRGRGLLLGAVLGGGYAQAVERSARAQGLLVNAVGSGVVRLAPALTITDDDIDEVVRRWGRALSQVSTQDRVE
jgi:acetylornithine/N-succinyldiaminopimelate aminotransferase